MAEVIGVVASGISIGSLAIQIVSSIQQLLDFWSTVKDAPENVQALLQEINILGNLLSEIDGNEGEEHSSVIRQAITKATEYCQLALDKIDTVLRDLASGLYSTRGRIKHWTAVKTALKDKRLEKSLVRLERAKSLLNLAYQCYTQARVKALQEFQRQKFRIIEDFMSTTQDMKSVSTSGPKDATYSVSKATNPRAMACRKALSNSRDEKSYWLVLGTLSIGSKASSTNDYDLHGETAQSEEYYIRMTNRISQHALEIFSTKIFGRWQHSFRSYNILTFDDPIYKACVSGDVELVNRLCVEGRATPYDTTSHGWSLLHVAAAFAHPSLCRWLISQGLDGNTSGTVSDNKEYGIDISYNSTTPLAVAANCSGRTGYNKRCSRLLANGDTIPLPNRDRPSDVVNTLRVLLEHGGSDPMLTDADGYTAFHQHTGSSEQFNYLLNQEHFQIDLLQRDHLGNTVAEHQAGWCWQESQELSRLAWKKERMMNQQELHSLQKPLLHDSSTVELLHRTAGSLQQRTREESTESSLLLIRQLIEGGTDPHAKTDCPYNLNSFAQISRTSSRERCDCSSDLTPLAQIAHAYDLGSSEDWKDPQATRQYIETKNILLAKAIDKWVKTLRDAGVHIEKYMQEEEKQSLQRKEKGDWDSYWWRSNHSVESRVEWTFHYRDRAEDCFITPTYEVRMNHDNEVAEKIPGAWTQEFQFHGCGRQRRL